MLGLDTAQRAVRAPEAGAESGQPAGVTHVERTACRALQVPLKRAVDAAGDRRHARLDDRGHVALPAGAAAAQHPHILHVRQLDFGCFGLDLPDLADGIVHAATGVRVRIRVDEAHAAPILQRDPADTGAGAHSRFGNNQDFHRSLPGRS